MTESQEMPSALGCYRVLDLAQGGCLIAGKILADLGADVIKIEPPGGDPSRNVGPFYKDTPDPGKSLFWIAYNVNKRSVTLDIESRDGQDILRRLVKSADFVIESFRPGYLEECGIGYTALSDANPRIVLTSITSFGQTGPKAQYKSSDLTAWAAGGYLYVSGDPSRAPNWISSPQASLHAGAEAAAASLIANWHRETTGRGQHVDVSIQGCVARILSNAAQFYDLNNSIVRRVGYHLPSPRFPMGLGYECKDGWITSYVMGGSAVGFASHMRSLVQWMDEEGMAPDWVKNFDWVNDMDASKLTQERYREIEEPFVAFFKAKSKQELFEGALKRKHMLIGPVQNTKEIAEDPQRQARDFWVNVVHPDLGDTLTLCGPFARLSQTPCRIRRRAPKVGEHNEEIYLGELGLSRQELAILKQARVV